MGLRLQQLRSGGFHEGAGVAKVRRRHAFFAKIARSAALCASAAVGLLNTTCALGTDEGLPPGALARVGDTIIDDAWLAAMRAELGPYGQLRFRGQEGFVSLLGVAIDIELLHQQAKSSGWADDPRVQFAGIEELARRQLDAELERRWPRSMVERDRATLEKWLAAHGQELATGERRSMWYESFATWGEAEAALAGYRAKTRSPEPLAKTGVTKLLRRDDHEFPFFHSVLFDPSLQPGEWLSRPVFTEKAVLVGRVEAIEPEKAASLDDPAVFARAVDGVLAERRPALERAYLREIMDRASR
jgi:hypothetical protein